ncbi:MAG: DoxX family protein [Bacteroidales bacterium]|jgi:hypothetical protein|nr:DoxX family protein [Bacteroidales bacterium]
MKIINYISRILVGVVFIFSGTVKAIDPLGSVYKFQDYFTAFNLGFLNDLSLLLAIILCSLEFLTGISVLFNIRFKAGIWTVILLMMVFTPLTLILALTNPVSDCGCFGDAVHLTNWQTFYKNIILMIPAIWLFVNRNKFTSPVGSARGWTLLSIVAVFFVGFIFYNLRYLPVIDFLPYKTGTYIPDKMIIPEGKPMPKYESTFIYEKDSERKEFDLTNYPAGDTTWKFVDQKSVLISKGYEPPIHDFVITWQGSDLVPMILTSENHTLLMVAKSLNTENIEPYIKGYETGRFCMENGIDFYVLSSSPENDSNIEISDLKVCTVDETTLKTMVRSDPGYLLLKKGTILHKWSWANLPEKEELIKITTKTNSYN